MDINKKSGLIRRTDIKKMMNMAQKYDISVDIIIEIPIREYGIKIRDIHLNIHSLIMVHNMYSNIRKRNRR